MQDPLIDVLKTLFRRDLEKLKKEIEAYQDENKLWIIDKAIPNSAGNLALHLAGNIRFFIGTQLGNTGYIRKRDEEFALKNVPRTELITEIDRTIEDVDLALDQLSSASLQQTYPIQVFGREMTTQYFLVHLAMHLDYHLGQVNYHRRLLD